MKFIFSAFINAAYQGKCITELGWDYQLLSFYDLTVKEQQNDLPEYVRIGWLKDYETKVKKCA